MKKQYHIPTRQLCINQTLSYHVGLVRKSSSGSFATLENQALTGGRYQDDRNPSIVLELAIVACLLGIIGHLVLVVGTREGAIVVLGLLAPIFRLLPLIIRR